MRGDHRGSIGRGLRPRAEQTAAGHFILGREGQPRGEVFVGRPAVHVRANFRDQFQGGIRTDAVNLREIHAAGEPMEGTDLEVRVIVDDAAMDPWRGERCRGGVLGSGQDLHVGLHGAIAGRQLDLTGVEEFQILLQDEEVLGPIVAGQGGEDLGPRGATPIIAVAGQVRRVVAASDNVAQDFEAGDAGDVTDDERQLDVHLHQRLLHPLDIRPGALHQGLPMAHVGAQRDNALGRAKTPPKQAHAMEVAQPFAVRHIAFATRDVLDVARVHEQDGDAAGLEDVVDWELRTTPVASIATLVMRQATDQSARRTKSVVNVVNGTRGWGLDSGGTAT